MEPTNLYPFEDEEFHFILFTYKEIARFLELGRVNNYFQLRRQFLKMHLF